MAVRAAIRAAIRAFFCSRGFLEVETPVRIAAPAPEPYLDPEPAGDFFLRTSPELQMKRLLAAGYGKIFQMGPCFRQDEVGCRHRPEFCMLEWYRSSADYQDILGDTRALLLYVTCRIKGAFWFVYQGQRIDLKRSWCVWKVRQAFLDHAGWDPFLTFQADRFDLDMVAKIEPAFPMDRALILSDFPPERAALARCERGAAQRWELYVGGMELANAYSELTCGVEQRQRFMQWHEQRKAAGKAELHQDELFLSALDNGMPTAGGIALGVDRLVMLLTDAAHIDEVAF